MLVVEEEEEEDKFELARTISVTGCRLCPWWATTAAAVGAELRLG